MAWSKLSNNIENCQKRRGLTIRISEKCKRMRCYPPPQSSGQIACVIFNLRGFRVESFFSAQGTLGLPNTLLFTMPEELIIKQHYFKI